MRFPWHMWIKLWVNRLCLGVSGAHATSCCSVSRVVHIGICLGSVCWFGCSILLRN